MATESFDDYKSNSMKMYNIMLEYKSLQGHIPNGVYILPTFNNYFLWSGVIFLRNGLYQKGIFKFYIEFSENYGALGSYPKVIFTSRVYHPYVHSQTGELDLKPRFSTWDKGVNHIGQLLLYIKAIFYRKASDYSSDCIPLNEKAFQELQHDKPRFLDKVEKCVQESIEKCYINDDHSSIKFSHPIPRHDFLREKLLGTTPEESLKSIKTNLQNAFQALKDDEE